MNRSNGLEILDCTWWHAQYRVLIATHLCSSIGRPQSENFFFGRIKTRLCFAATKPRSGLFSESVGAKAGNHNLRPLSNHTNYSLLSSHQGMCRHFWQRVHTCRHAVCRRQCTCIVCVVSGPAIIVTHGLLSSAVDQCADQCQLCHLARYYYLILSILDRNPNPAPSDSLFLFQLLNLGTQEKSYSCLFSSPKISFQPLYL